MATPGLACYLACKQTARSMSGLDAVRAADSIGVSQPAWDRCWKIRKFAGGSSWPSGRAVSTTLRNSRAKWSPRHGPRPACWLIRDSSATTSKRSMCTNGMRILPQPQGIFGISLHRLARATRAWLSGSALSSSVIQAMSYVPCWINTERHITGHLVDFPIGADLDASRARHDGFAGNAHAASPARSRSQAQVMPSAIAGRRKRCQAIGVSSVAGSGGSTPRSAFWTSHCPMTVAIATPRPL